MGDPVGLVNDWCAICADTHAHSWRLTATGVESNNGKTLVKFVATTTCLNCATETELEPDNA